MIHIENASKTYTHHAEQVTALDRVTMNIEAGEFVSIVGPSGSGKSTLLLLMGGMLSPSEGTVSIDNTNIYDLSPNDRSRFRGQHIGFLFQRFHLIPYLTALENVTVPFLLQGDGGEAARERATELLTRVQLDQRLDHKPGEMSVGQQQRVALARMLANDPPVILADEPTGNLDPQTGGAIIGFLLELNKAGKTIVMVTHTPEAARMTSRMISLTNGAFVN
ncbi:MAG: ABC transporter ATP-binding protein [Desulfobacteraceae bacterium]|nr:ABC transporter ATP-binding protein [Desulfobacteraceae bacterium]